MKYKLIALCCLLASIVLMVSSSAKTSLFFYSFSENDLFGILMLGVGIAFDFGKIAFPALAVYYFHKDKYAQVLVFAVLAVSAMGISYFASMAFDLNSNNEIKNEAVATSTLTKRNEELFKTTNQTVEQLRNDIAHLRKNKDSEVKKASEGLRTQKSALPSDYVTRKNQIQAQINNTESKARQKIDNEIAQKEKLLLQKEGNLAQVQQDFSKIGNVVNTTKGVYALAKWLSPTNPDNAVGKIGTVKNILEEIFAVAFAMAFGALVGKNNINKVISPIINKKPSEAKKYTLKRNVNIIPNATAKKIGFEAPEKSTKSIIDGVSNDDVKRYIKAMINSLKNDNSVNGFAKLGKEAQLTESKARKVYGYLEQSKIIKAENRKTYVIEKDKLKSMS